MRTRLFLRTMEFLWQEGHTAHETAEECEEETRRMLEVYAEFAENVLAMPVLKGEKTERERFAGADRTYCIEAMMQDGKALQAGTSHNLGQNFAKAFDISFQTRDQKQEHAWTTSWGVSTRLIGGVIMTHSDDEGLILPPRIAPVLCAIVPIYRKDADREAVIAYARQILVQLCGEAAVERAENAIGHKEVINVVVDGGRRVVLDLRDGMRPPDKFFHWEQKGTPVRVEVGPRDLEGGKAMVVTRHPREKNLMDVGEVTQAWLHEYLEGMQQALLDRARSFRIENTVTADSYDELKAHLGEGRFVLMHWDGTTATEEKVQQETKATIRCIPWEDAVESKDGPVDVREPGTDPVSGAASAGRVIFARAY